MICVSYMCMYMLSIMCNLILIHTNISFSTLPLNDNFFPRLLKTERIRRRQIIGSINCRSLSFFKNLYKNFVGRGENVGYEHFLVFPQCSQKNFFPLFRLQDCLAILSFYKEFFFFSVGRQTRDW